MVRLFACATLCVGLALAPLAQAQVNKCVDANGKTIYSQAPCPANTKSSSMRPSPAAAQTPVATDAKADSKGAAAKSAGPKTAAELERDFRKRRSEADAAGKKAEESLAEAKNRDENCKSAKGQLVNLESGARQVRLDESGERIFLNADQVARETERARQAVQAWCK